MSRRWKPADFLARRPPQPYQFDQTISTDDSIPINVENKGAVTPPQNVEAESTSKPVFKGRKSIFNAYFEAIQKKRLNEKESCVVASTPMVPEYQHASISISPICNKTGKTPKKTLIKTKLFPKSTPLSKDESPVHSPDNSVPSTSKAYTDIVKSPTKHGTTPKKHLNASIRNRVTKSSQRHTPQKASAKKIQHHMATSPIRFESISPDKSASTSSPKTNVTSRRKRDASTSQSPTFRPPRKSVLKPPYPNNIVSSAMDFTNISVPPTQSKAKHRKTVGTNTSNPTTKQPQPPSPQNSIHNIFGTNTSDHPKLPIKIPTIVDANRAKASIRRHSIYKKSFSKKKLKYPPRRRQASMRAPAAAQVSYDADNSSTGSSDTRISTGPNNNEPTDDDLFVRRAGVINSRIESVIIRDHDDEPVPLTTDNEDVAPVGESSQRNRTERRRVSHEFKQPEPADMFFMTKRVSASKDSRLTRRLMSSFEMHQSIQRREHGDDKASTSKDRNKKTGITMKKTVGAETNIADEAKPKNVVNILDARVLVQGMQEKYKDVTMRKSRLTEDAQNVPNEITSPVRTAPISVIVDKLGESNGQKKEVRQTKDSAPSRVVKTVTNVVPTAVVTSMKELLEASNHALETLGQKRRNDAKANRKQANRRKAEASLVSNSEAIAAKNKAKDSKVNRKKDKNLKAVDVPVVVSSEVISDNAEDVEAVNIPETIQVDVHEAPSTSKGTAKSKGPQKIETAKKNEETKKVEETKKSEATKKRERPKKIESPKKKESRAKTTRSATRKAAEATETVANDIATKTSKKGEDKQKKEKLKDDEQHVNLDQIEVVETDLQLSTADSTHSADVKKQATTKSGQKQPKESLNVTKKKKKTTKGKKYFDDLLDYFSMFSGNKSVGTSRSGRVQKRYERTSTSKVGIHEPTKPKTRKPPAQKVVVANVSDDNGNEIPVEESTKSTKKTVIKKQTKHDRDINTGTTTTTVDEVIEEVVAGVDLKKPTPTKHNKATLNSRANVKKTDNIKLNTHESNTSKSHSNEASGQASEPENSNKVMASEASTSKAPEPKTSRSRAPITTSSKTSGTVTTPPRTRSRSKTKQKPDNTEQIILELQEERTSSEKRHTLEMFELVPNIENDDNANEIPVDSLRPIVAQDEEITTPDEQPYKDIVFKKPTLTAPTKKAKPTGLKGPEPKIILTRIETVVPETTDGPVSPPKRSRRAKQLALDRFTRKRPVTRSARRVASPADSGVNTSRSETEREDTNEPANVPEFSATQSVELTGNAESCGSSSMKTPSEQLIHDVINGGIFRRSSLRKSLAMTAMKKTMIPDGHGRMKAIVWASHPPVFDDEEEISICTTLKSFNNMKFKQISIKNGKMKPPSLSRHNLIFVIVGGEAEVQMHNRMDTFSVGGVFTVPKNIEYYIKNVGTGDLRLLHMIPDAFTSEHI